MVRELTSSLQSCAIGVPKHFDNEHETVPVLRPFHLLQFYNCDLQDLKFSHNAKSTLPQGSSPFFQLVCQHSQSGITTSVAAFASNTVESLSTAHVKTSLAPGCTLTTKFSVRRAPDTIRFPCSSAVEAFSDLSCPPRLDWLVLVLLRPTRKGLW